jgi:hypothetical protein
MSAEPWAEIMGPSVHVVNVEGVKFPKYVWDFEQQRPKPEHLELVNTLVLKRREQLKAAGS